MQKIHHLAVIGTGPAGISAAVTAAGAQKSVVLIDHRAQPAQKLMMTGGGKCNFSNKFLSAQHYFSQNPHFCKSALARLPVADVLAFCRENRLEFCERDDGKYFASSARDVRDMLMRRLDSALITCAFGQRVTDITLSDGVFCLVCADTTLYAKNLLIATGGLSVPATGATDFAFRTAEKFGLKIVPTFPVLTPMIFSEADAAAFAELSGVSCFACISCGKKNVRHDLLFTHTGFSGPAVLQTSLYRTPEQPVTVNFLPDTDVFAWLKKAKADRDKRLPASVLSDKLPHRLAQRFALLAETSKPLTDTADKSLEKIGNLVNRFTFQTLKNAGYDKAEVTKGGVDTAELSSQTMESRAVKGLYFAGECVDVTGEVGGFNLHWAFASGKAAGTACAVKE